MLHLILFCAAFSTIFAAHHENVDSGESENRRILITRPLPRPFIVGGVQEKQPIYYQASLRVQHIVGSVKPSSLTHFCGGTFVDSNIVVTAAHCLESSVQENVQSGRVYVVGGTNFLNYNPRTTFISVVTKAETHPQYNITPLANDIAVLKLREGYHGKENVGSVSLRSLRLRRGRLCKISGWGTTEYGEDERSSMILRSAYVPVLDTAACRKRFRAMQIDSVISDDMICAGYEQGGTDACQGDSGGPLICDGELAGVVSWGYECALPHMPGVYANVSHLRKWVQGAIKSLQGLPVPSTPKASNAEKLTMDQLACTVLVLLTWLLCLQQ